ncbi:MAG: hypothetical protein ACLPID_13335 [Beijerinckiaceae bacterium]
MALLEAAAGFCGKSAGSAALGAALPVSKSALVPVFVAFSLRERFPLCWKML